MMIAAIWAREYYVSPTNTKAYIPNNQIILGGLFNVYTSLYSFEAIGRNALLLASTFLDNSDTSSFGTIGGL